MDAGRIRLLLALLALTLVSNIGPARASDTAPRAIAVFQPGIEPQLRYRGLAIWGRAVEGVVAGGTLDALAELAADGIVPLARFDDHGEWMYLLSHREEFPLPAAPGARIEVLSPQTALYLFPAGERVTLPHVRPNGAFMALARVPLPPIEPHPADRLPPRAPSAANPLVAQIMAATDRATWFQAVKDLSGENPVDIGGTSYTISTRYTDAMFPTPQDNARATEYILDRAAGWGYTDAVRETYTAAESGCGGQGTWQNVIITIPGQVDAQQRQQVLFVNHYDSLSFSTSESLNYAPGADDAISGGVALLEALRTFRNFAFRNTVKIAFFTGEEEGICGSGAYVRQHSPRNMWRAVNMDQTAFDGDLNRLMDVYNWDATNSPASVALGDAFVQANADYGPFVDPAKIVRDTSKMCQTDHCPFWNVGVGAIAVTEDLHDNDICPCFDQSQSPDCHDTVTQLWNGRPMFDQDYSWPSEQGAIATVAALAEPLYACPAAAPAVRASGSNNTVHLAWDEVPGVTDYAIERAPTCAGPFTGIGTSKTASFDDITAVNGTPWAYRVRTCPTQAGACATAAAHASPSVIVQAGSAVVTADSGDHDNVPDDCELVTVQLTLVNDGNTPLTNVRLLGVTPAHPAVEIASAVPEVAAASLAAGASAPVSFKFWLGRNGSVAACGDALPFQVTAVANEAPPSAPRDVTLYAERTPQAGPLAYGFETDFSGWTVTSGVFTHNTGGVPTSPAGSLHSRNVSNDCDAVVSPVIVPTATSKMTMGVQYDIESGSADRALIRAVDTVTGVKTLLVPTGQVYNTTGNQNLLCDNVGNLQGWSGSTNWRQAAFDLAPFAGQSIRIEARYSTNSYWEGTKGFWMDNVQVTNATQLNCDVPAACTALPPEVSPAGSAVPFTIARTGTGYRLRFSESTGAATYNVYAGTLASLAAGLYDHASAAGLCGLTDATPGDGSVTVNTASLASNAYFLAVARSSAGESVYGHSSAGATIPLALSNCP